MPFCASCGTQAEGAFCPKCGAPVGATAPPPPGVGVPPPMPGAAPMADNVAGALCYVLGFITGIIFLVIAPYNQNRTIRFHAFQSIFLSVGLIFVRIAISIVFGIIFATGGFWFMYALFFPLFGLLCLVIWLYVMFQTYQGKTIVLPIIGPLAQKQA